jgi:hypothetical protein
MLLGGSSRRAARYADAHGIARYAKAIGVHVTDCCVNYVVVTRDLSS